MSAGDLEGVGRGGLQAFGKLDEGGGQLTQLCWRQAEDGGFLGGEYSAATENAIREVFALLALNYVAILMLQGRNIARLVPEGSTPKTLGDWLSGYLSASPIAGMLSGEATSEGEAEVA